ncbi:MAG: glycerophosphodiester phosphodiesterase family protein [Rothia sp. (in: high G+C Gram-positive bacteria)]|nr:glycerophosphodiester phosphodiesterase family protein [Rothia sp. (in: high G+C Gram-positive bacteria)]
MRIFAHRGASGTYPENTLAVFAAAADSGATWVETDVDVAACGTPVLLHDTQLRRTTNLAGSVYDYTAVQLQGADAGAWFSAATAGQAVPTLRQLVDLANERGLNLNVELKTNEQGAVRSRLLVSRVIEELERLHPGREVIVSSFNHLLLAEFKRLAPQYVVGALFERRMFQPGWRSMLELMQASAAHLSDADATCQRVRDVRDAGYEVNIWTVNSPARANELKNWGATGIFTDYPERLLHLEH